MTNTLKRVFLAVAVLGLGLIVAAPVLADTGPWTWTDLSGQIAERANRPIWAIGRAEPYWYFTDGQNLWNGGHVWKTDGSILSDITTDVRDAGIDRVDDIVSDGQTVLFLENVTSKNNTFEIVADNGTAVNETNIVRGYVNSNEGIASITGKNGTWAIVTTEGRVLVGSFGTSFTTVLAPNQIAAYNGDIAYSTRHVSPSDSEPYLPISMVPTSSGWLLAYRDPNLGYTRFFSYSTNSGMTDITSRFARITYLQAMSSNGTTALVAGGDTSTSLTNHVFTFDGFTATDVTTQAAALPMTSWNRTLIAWNGDSWMITDTNKDLVRFDGTNFQNYGTTADYFVTLSGNSSGSFLIGGADSVAGLMGPSSPLTAKLVKVTENANGSNSTNTNNSTAFGGGRTTTSANGPTVTTSGNPSNFIVGNGGTFDYLVSASDPNGVSHIDVYANGGLIKSCYATTCEFDSQYFTNGQSTRAIPFYAVATDNQGYATNGSSNQDSLTVDQNSSASANTNGTNNTAQTQNGISFWTWFDPNQTNIGQSQFMNFLVGTYSTAGIRSVQIFVNGTVKQTCNLNNATGNQQCSASLYGGDYGLNSSVAVNAEITDANGQVAWTPVQNLTVTTSSTSTGTNTNNSDVSAWFTLSPTGSTLSRSSSVTMNVSAAATEGLSTINVYANGTIIRTCNFSQVSGTQTCSATVYGSNYGNGTQLTLNAQATGVDGMTAWSNSQVLTVQDNGTTNTGNATSWISSSPDTSTLSQGQSVTFTVNANDPQGLQRIDIYVNGTTGNTCNFGNSTGNQSCSTVVNASSYSNGSNVYVNAKITDSQGNITWSDSRNYTISSNGSTQTGTNTNTNGSSWVWSTPETSTLAQGSSAVFSVGANDPDGISRIDIVAGGAIVNTCNLNNATGNQSCSATISANSYSVGTSVFVNAKVTDIYGNVLWSGSRNYTITSNGSTQTTTQTGTNSTAPSTWIWTTPANQTQFTAGSTATFSVGAWSQNGIQKIEVYANGAIVQTCNLGSAYGNQQCSYNVTANTAGTTSVYVNAKVTDTQGNVSWSEAETYTFTGTGSTSTGTGSTGFPTDLPGTIQVSSDHDAGFSPNDLITYTATASDQNGIDRIDILVNGVLVKTCTNSSTCTYTGGSYNGRTTVSYGAKIVDKDGFALWTGYKTINAK
ncbi:MAG: Ig-like domain-containing protein [Patescibacteria group bacterium]